MARRGVIAAAFAAGVLALVAAGCGGSSASTNAAGTTSPGTSSGTGPPAGNAAFRTCLTQHGVTAPPQGGTPPNGGAGGFSALSPTQRKALQACASLRPAGSRRPAGSQSGALAKYTACLRTHGVTFGSSNGSSKFHAAQKACRSLLPAQTTTPTTTTP
jgi:hypothetical protein